MPTNNDIKLDIIRKHKLYSEKEIENFKYDENGIPLRTYTDWISKGYMVRDEAEGYKATLWLKKKNEGFIKRIVTLYSGHDVYKEDSEDFDTGIWRDQEITDEAWENLGRY